MALNRVRFGDYIKLVKEKCGISNLTPNDVSGINRDKEFFEPSKQVGSDTSSYKIVPPNCFACNIMHVGRDVVLPIALNTSNKNKIVSPAYIVFEWTGEKVLLKEYLFIMLKSNEKDRYFWFHCDSSVRDGMDWDAFCDIELEVPSIEIQKKYVAIYEGLLANLRSYEKGLDDLKITYEALIEKTRRENGAISVIDYIEESTEINNGRYGKNYLKGVGKEGFITPKQDRTDESLKKCGVFHLGDLVYNPSVLYDGAIAINKDYENAICTEEYIIFHPKDTRVLRSEYLFMWLKRSECGRYIDFKSVDSVRNRVYFRDLEMIKIPIVSIEQQDFAVSIFNAYCFRKENVDRLKQQIMSICPILIRGSVLEAQGGENA